MANAISPELAAAGASLASTLGLSGATVPSWAELDAAFQQQLGGPFDLTDPKHQALALGLTAMVGERFRREHGAFWFSQADAVGGASVGFPDAVLPVSPSALVTLALREGNLAALDTGFADVLRELGAARASAAKMGRALTATDYAQLFDPSFVDFAALDPKVASKAYERSPMELAGLLQDALFRAPGLTREGKHWVEDLAFSLRLLDPKRSLVSQALGAPRAFERVAHLFGAVYGTGPIALGGWSMVAMRLIALDASAAPAVPADPAAALARAGGVVPLYLGTAPRLAEAPSEGVLGLFQPSELQPIDPRLGNLGDLRLIRINPRGLLPLLQKHDPARVQAAVAQFAGKLGAKVTPRETAMLTDALAFVRRLQDTLAYAIRDQLDFTLLRLSQFEAQTTSQVGPLRQVLES